MQPLRPPNHCTLVSSAKMVPGIDSPYLNPVLRGILNGVVFCLSLLLLERSADVFVDSTNVVAKRFGLPTILVGLLTAGAEWEEVSRRRTTLLAPSSLRYLLPGLVPHPARCRSLLAEQPKLVIGGLQRDWFHDR